MAKITLPQTTFKVIPEGEHIFCIYRVDYNEKFGKLNIYMVTADGHTHIERFSFLKHDGNTNDGAYTAFAYFAKTVMNDFSLSDVDPYLLKGKYLKGVIEHNVVPKRDNPEETMTFTKIADKSPATGFDKTPCEKAVRLCTETEVKAKPVKETKKEEPPKAFNLDDILN